jgi:signal transduction histidine kinase
MKSDRLGLLMIAASFAVIALVFALIHSQEAKRHQDKVRVVGVAITRALAGADLADLVPTTGRTSLVNTVASVQGSDAFAYGAVVSPAGLKLLETASAGSIVPAAAVPSKDPSSWFGERTLASPGDGREVREFFGPVLKAGELAGFVRVGFYAKPADTFSTSRISYAALLALPVFLLTVLAYFMIRREIRPLARLGEKMEEFGRMHGLERDDMQARLEFRDFAERFNQFMQLVQSRVNDVDRERVTAQTSTQLLVYKQEKANAALDAMPEAVLVVDEMQVPTYANPKVEPLLGVKRSEIIGEPPHKWCRNKEVLALLARLGKQGGIVSTGSIEYSPEDDPERRISASTYPLFSPRAGNMLLGMLVLFRDVTEEYRARQAGSEFVAQVSHELKTPLANISAYSELLMEHAGLDEGERVNAVNVIHDETERATALITNLLNLSKLDTGTLPIHRQRVQMADVLRDAADSMGKAAQTKNIAIDLTLPPDLGSARVDKSLFRVVIDNLISNAIKYSDPGSRIRIAAEKLDDLEMKITVRDSGIGISPADAEKVFDKYFRSDDKALGARPGHGLGLYLAKQIVELHHGSIDVKSEPGKGSEFTVQFQAQSQTLEEVDA